MIEIEARVREHRSAVPVCNFHDAWVGSDDIDPIRSNQGTGCCQRPTQKELAQGAPCVNVQGCGEPGFALSETLAGNQYDHRVSLLTTCRNVRQLCASTSRSSIERMT